MINLPFNTLIVFGKPDPKYGYKLLLGIFRPGFIATLDKWGLVEIRKGYNLQLYRSFRICNFKLAR